MGGGGASEGGEEVFDEEGVRELVGTELVLVAVLGGAGGDGHGAGVADEVVQRRDSGRQIWRAEWTEVREVWSQVRKVMEVQGWVGPTSAMTLAAREALRPVE